MPVTIRAFSHIVLPVADLDAALAFYRDLLGLKVVMRLEPDNSGPEGSIAAGLAIAGVLVPGGTMLELVQGTVPVFEAASRVEPPEPRDIPHGDRHRLFDIFQGTEHFFVGRDEMFGRIYLDVFAVYKNLPG